MIAAECGVSYPGNTPIESTGFSTMAHALADRLDVTRDEPEPEPVMDRPEVSYASAWTRKPSRFAGRRDIYGLDRPAADLGGPVLSLQDAADAAIGRDEVTRPRPGDTKASERVTPQNTSSFRPDNKGMGSLELRGWSWYEATSFGAEGRQW